MKLPESLLLEIESLREELADNIIEIGKANIDLDFHKKEILELEKRLESFYVQAKINTSKEKELQTRIVSEYGEGLLNFETGEYTKKEGN